MKPTAEELLAGLREANTLRWANLGSWTFASEIAVKALDALNAVLAIPAREDAYAPGANIDRDYGYNQALVVVRAEIEGELR